MDLGAAVGLVGVVLLLDMCTGVDLALLVAVLDLCWNSVEASAERKSADMAIGLN